MSSFATDFYVAADGNDANDGLTAATAKATIAGGYTAMTNGTPEATYGNRLVIGAGTFDLPATTTVLDNGWKIVGAGMGETTLKVTAKVSQFALNSADSALRNLTVDFVGSSIDMRAIVGGLSKDPKGVFENVEVANFYNGWSENMLSIGAAAASPVFTNCIFRNYTICLGNLVKISNVDTTPQFVNCSFVDGGSRLGNYGNVGMFYVVGAKPKVTMRNCLFLRCENSLGSNIEASTGTIYANANTTIENCSIINSSFKGTAFDSADPTAAVNCGPIIGGPTVINTLVVGCKNVKDVLQPCRNGSYTYCASDAALPDGEGNVQLTYQNFAWQGEDDYHEFIPSSDATVDCGKTLDWMPGAKDLHGADRIIGTAPDIGCYEYLPPPKVYVAKDGNDANDGLSRANAKATIQAGYAVITNMATFAGFGANLVVGDGEWTSDDVVETLVLSNGWSLVGENGREKTVFKTLVNNFTFFTLATAGASVRGITFDYNRSANIRYSQEMVRNPKGLIADCEFRNGYVRVAWYFPALMMIGVDGIACSPAIKNCIFRNNYCHYNGASCIVTDVNAKNLLIADCSFIDNKAGSSDWPAAGTICLNRAIATVRNCLFLRSEGYSNAARGCIVSAGSSGGNSTIENCTFVDCTLHGNADAGAVGHFGSANSGYVPAKFSVINCLAWGNTNTAAGAYMNFATNTPSNATLTFEYCAGDKKVDGEGNVAIDPANFRWKSVSKGDYAVRTGSPLNAGTNLAWMVGAKDLMGRDRVIGGQVDIGAFEYDFNEPGMVVIFR